MTNFHQLTVSRIQELTPNAVAVTLQIPASLKDTFSFVSGQYITIKHNGKHGEVRRAYSISSAPTAPDITVGIKKVTEGNFSVYANTTLKEGDILEVMPPEGRFIFEPSNTGRHIAAFAAGSGITPIISIAESVLTSHLHSTFTLVYGNQNPEETMFNAEVKALSDKYTNRFFVQNCYSKAQEEGALFGRIDASVTNYIVKNKFKDTVFDAFYLCGPESMIDTVTATLKNNGVSENKILFELFTATDAVDTIAENVAGKTTVEVLVDDASYSFSMDKKTLVLDAVLKEDIDAPYSCQGGVCSSCIARVTEGKAEMVKNQILTDGEIAEGLILTCQAHPLTDTLKVDYDDV